jgi:GT2 family glycosyltransferase
MKVAIVILNWNGLGHLKTFFSSVSTYSESYPVYVIDNASTDDSVLWLKQNFPTTIVISNPQNEGFCRGYNLGLQQIEADYFVLLNSDVEVTDNWISPIIHLMEEDQMVAACQPKILAYLDKQKFEYAGAAGGFIDWLGYPFCRGRVFETQEEDTGQFDDTKEVFWATGACFFVRAALFNELGGFDESFFAHMEEIDLCWRLKNRGYKIMYEGSSKVYHLGGGTLQQTSPYKSFLNFRNGLFLLYKNLPQKRLSSTIFIRLLLDGVAGIRFFAKFEMAMVWSIIKAHGYFYSALFRNQIKRDNLKNVETKPILYTSIVWDYFAKGKKKYSELMS